MNSLSETTKIQSDQIQAQLLQLHQQSDSEASQANQDRLQLTQLKELQDKLRYEL